MTSCSRVFQITEGGHGRFSERLQMELLSYTSMLTGRYWNIADVDLSVEKLMGTYIYFSGLIEELNSLLWACIKFSLLKPTWVELKRMEGELSWVVGKRGFNGCGCSCLNASRNFNLDCLHKPSSTAKKWPPQSQLHPGLSGDLGYQPSTPLYQKMGPHCRPVTVRFNSRNTSPCSFDTTHMTSRKS